MLREENPERESLTQLQWKLFDEVEHNERGLPNLPDLPFKSLSRLFDSEWFHRLWVFRRLCCPAMTLRCCVEMKSRHGSVFLGSHVGSGTMVISTKELCPSPSARSLPRFRFLRLKPDGILARLYTCHMVIFELLTREIRSTGFLGWLVHPLVPVSIT